MGVFPESHIHTFYDKYQEPILVGSEVVDVHIYDTDYDPSELLPDDDTKTQLLPDVDAAMAVFSTASRESLMRLQLYADFFVRFQQNGGSVCLVGTHTDVDPPQVSREQASRIAKKIGAELFLVCVKTREQAMEFSPPRTCPAYLRKGHSNCARDRSIETE